MKIKSLKVVAALLGLMFVGTASVQSAVTIPPYPQANWEVLFDGKEIKGMRGYRRTDIPYNCWKVEDGMLKTVPGAKDRADLITVKQYKDFQLEFEWAVLGSSNGGVFYRGQETKGPIWHTAPEYQLLDDGGHGDGRFPNKSAGALYAMIEANNDKTVRPLKQFNKTKIVCKDNKVEHWLNGMMVVSYTWGSDEAKELIAKSKFKDKEQFMQFEKGHIGFQHHGEEIWLKNIRITEL